MFEKIKKIFKKKPKAKPKKVEEVLVLNEVKKPKHSNPCDTCEIMDPTPKNFRTTLR